MKKNLLYFLFPSFLIITACNRSYNYPSAQVTDYMQLQPGKYITYRLDSLVFTNFGTQDTVVSYLAMDIIDSLITDDLGRPSWRVIRYLSDTTGSAPWTPNETYMITPTRQAIEMIENNLRYLKLELPIVNGFSWSGNSYIDTRTTYSDVPGLGNWDYSYLDGWSYTYDSVGSPFTVLAGTIPNSITVQQAADSTGTPSNIVDSVVSSITYSEEIYGKGIGLIYKNFIYWQYQPPNVGSPSGSKIGYGIKLNMVNHN
jgi:hypothetical protein